MLDDGEREARPHEVDVAGTTREKADGLGLLLYLLHLVPQPASQAIIKIPDQQTETNTLNWVIDIIGFLPAGTTFHLLPNNLQRRDL
jgi:hypothetical protein